MDFWKRMAQIGKEAGPLLQLLKFASAAQLIRQAQQLYEKGEYEEALEIVTRASEEAQQWFTETAKQVRADVDAIESYNLFNMNADQLAMLHYAMGNYVEAARLLRTALEMQQKIFTHLRTEPDLAYSHTLGVLATLYCSMGDYSQAEALLQEGLDIRQKFAEKHIALFSKFLLSLDVETAPIRTNLGMAFALIGNFAKAEETLQQALTTYRALDMERHRAGRDRRHPASNVRDSWSLNARYVCHQIISPSNGMFSANM